MPPRRGRGAGWRCPRAGSRPPPAAATPRSTPRSPRRPRPPRRRGPRAHRRRSCRVSRRGGRL